MKSAARGRILIVDDEEVLLELVGQFCEHAGYDVMTAVKGLEGVEWALLNAPDVILMDVNMPDISGWEALARLKADARTRAIPVVMMTGFATDERARPVEAAEMLRKPFSVAALLETLERLC